jgi:ketosteroid isomerase-like protein
MAVSDEQAIQNILYQYGYLIDAGDFAGIGRLFGDAVLSADGTELGVSGAEAIQKYYEGSTRIYEDTGTPKTKHVFTNFMIEIDDDGGALANSKANYFVLQQTDVLPVQVIISGHYEHRYKKRDGAWRMTHKKFFVDQLGDLSQHLLFSLSDAQKNPPDGS